MIRARTPQRTATNSRQPTNLLKREKRRATSSTSSSFSLRLLCRCQDHVLVSLAICLCFCSFLASQWASSTGHQNSVNDANEQTEHLNRKSGEHKAMEPLAAMTHQAELSRHFRGGRRRQQAVILDLGAPPNYDEESTKDLEIVPWKDDEGKPQKKKTSWSTLQPDKMNKVVNLNPPEQEPSAPASALVNTKAKAKLVEESRPSTTVWNQRTASQLKSSDSSFPIINMGLPRSGQDTLWNFFGKLGYVTQYGCGDKKKPREGCTSLGYYMKKNVDEGKSILEGMELAQHSDTGNTTNTTTQEQQKRIQVYTQLEAPRVLTEFRPILIGLILPQVTHMQELYKAAPNATWILPLHDQPQHWAYTISRHHTLRLRLWYEQFVTKHNLSDSLPTRQRDLFLPQPEEIPVLDWLTNFYAEHTRNVRAFVKEHPSIRLVEWNYRIEPTDLLQSLGLPLPESENTNWTEIHSCQGNECDLWNKEVAMVNHYKETPKPTMKLPTPIFVVGFPKSGTTSVYNFFSCAGVRSQHYCCCGDISDHRPCFSETMAECILRNQKEGRPWLEECTGKSEQQYELFAQLDGERSIPLGNGTHTGGHFLPQVHDLDWIHSEYPNATFILPLREPRVWAGSVSRWFNMKHRLVAEYDYRNQSHIVNPKLPLVSMYEAHTQNVIDFVRRHPSHMLIKFNITQPDAGQILSQATGLTESCWGHHNQNNVRLK